MKHESIGIPLGLGQKVEVLTLPKYVPEWTGDRIQTNAKGQMRTNFVENEEANQRLQRALEGLNAPSFRYIPTPTPLLDVMKDMQRMQAEWFNATTLQQQADAINRQAEQMWQPQKLTSVEASGNCFFNEQTGILTLQPGARYVTKDRYTIENCSGEIATVYL